jgi:hypothetical protein
VTFANLRAGQTANTPGLDDVHLVHTTTGMFDRDMIIASDTGLNDRAPHLAPYGTNRMLAAWETSTKTDHLVGPCFGTTCGALQLDTSRKMYVQSLNATTGAAEGPAYNVVDGTAQVVGSRFQDFRAYPDGSVAYAAPAQNTATSKIKIVRVLACQ